MARDEKQSPAARVRITVDFAPEDLARIDRAAVHAGKSRASFLRDAADAEATQVLVDEKRRKGKRVLGKEGKQ